MTTALSSHTPPVTNRGIDAPQNGHHMKRIWNVTRLHVVNKGSVFWLPLSILAFIWLVNVAIWWIIQSTAGSDTDMSGTQWTGASSFIFIFMTVIAAQAMSMTFPFALGLSVTRRDFYLGSILAFALLSVAWGLLMTVLSFLEEATNGWGFNGTMFSAIYFGYGPFLERFFVFAVGFLFFFVMGTLGGTIYMRWRTFGLTAAIAIATVILIGLVALVTFTENWPLVGEWFVASGPTGVVAWLIAPIVIFGIAGYLALRKATPKN